MFDVSFLRPHYLTALLVVIPLITGLWYASFVSRRKARAEFGDRKLIGRFSKPLTLRSELFLVATWVAAVSLMVVAIAGPVSKSLPTTVKSGSLQVVAVVDVSKSMGAEDYRPIMPAKDGYEPELVPGPYGSRVDFVKLLLRREVMPAIIGNQLGVVLYTGEGFEQVPLTDDWSATTWVLQNWMKVGNAPGNGSDYAEGMGLALDMLKRDHIPGKEKVIILFTDGGFTGEQETLEKVLTRVKDENARLIIVGVGGRVDVSIPIYDDKGNVTGVETKDNQPLLTSLDEGKVIELATLADSEYFILDPSSNGKLGVTWAAKLGGSKAESKEKPVYQYPLGVAIILLFGLFLRGLFVRRESNFNGG